jgi:sugar lactone lactonase YvrE
VWFDTGLSRKSDLRQLLPDPPKPEGVEAALEQTRHTTDYGFADSMAFDGTRYIYVGTVAGVLCRIDTHTDKVEKIAHVMSTGRFPALAFAPDGTLCGAGGMNGHTQIMRWRPGSDRIESYLDLRDPVLDEAPERVHEIAVDADGTLYLAENDNHHRSSYLWTARLDT